MLEGWFCRNKLKTKEEKINEEEVETNNTGTDDDDEDSQDERINQQIVDYKGQYQNMKKKLKFLIYENEVFQDSLRSSQRRLLKVTRDKSFLLDRLLQYEKPEITSSESEETESSDDDNIIASKKRKSESSSAVGNNHNFIQKNQNPIKRKRPPPKKQGFSQAIHGNLPKMMTAEEVERHLQSRKYMIPEKTPISVPNEMFSLDDSESNDQLIETSP